MECALKSKLSKLTKFQDRIARDEHITFLLWIKGRVNATDETTDGNNIFDAG